MDFIIIYLYYPTFFDKMTIINSSKSGSGKPHYNFIYTATGCLMDNTSIKAFTFRPIKQKIFGKLNRMRRFRIAIQNL